MALQWREKARAVDAGPVLLLSQKRTLGGGDATAVELSLEIPETERLNGAPADIGYLFVIIQFFFSHA